MGTPRETARWSTSARAERTASAVPAAPAGCPSPPHRRGQPPGSPLTSQAPPCPASPSRKACSTSAQGSRRLDSHRPTGRSTAVAERGVHSVQSRSPYGTRVASRSVYRSSAAQPRAQSCFAVSITLEEPSPRPSPGHVEPQNEATALAVLGRAPLRPRCRGGSTPGRRCRSRYVSFWSRCGARHLTAHDRGGR